MSSKVLSGLENVDDDLGRKDILIVKMDKDRNDISGINVDEFPAVVFYDEQVPTVFQGWNFYRNLILLPHQMAPS